MRKSGYQITNLKDRSNAFGENHLFDTLEEAREWSDEIWEQIQECEKDCDFLEDDEKTKKTDLAVEYFEKGVQRGEYPLFTE